MVIQMSCVRLNCHSAVHTQTQTQTETEGYRKHSFSGKTATETDRLRRVAF